MKELETKAYLDKQVAAKHERQELEKISEDRHAKHV
jgi:hypothetical protein